MMKYLKYTLILLTAALLGACSKSAFSPIGPNGPKGGITKQQSGEGLKPLGLVKVTIKGIGTQHMTASAHSVAPRAVVPGAASGITLPGTGSKHTIQMKLVSNGSFTYGKRPPAGNGVRYIYAVFKVRNADSSGTAYSKARHNLTLLAVNTDSGPLKTYGHTAITKMSLFNGQTPSNPAAVADSIIPTGKVELNAAGKLASSYPDVLQVFKESEVQSIDLPDDSPVTDIFPWGFVVRNPDSTDNRTLPVATSSDEYDGIVTFAFKLPLKKLPKMDPFKITMVFEAVDDGTTQITRSIQEALYGGEPAFEQRAMDLQASMVTLLGNTDYNGTIASRTICGARVAGTKGAPTATLTSPAGCGTQHKNNNLIENGGFETWSNSVPQGWTIVNAASAGSKNGNGDFSKGTGTNNVHSGNSSLKVTISSSGKTYNTQILTSKITTTKGDTYKVTFWIKASESGAIYQVEGRSGGTDKYHPASVKYSAKPSTPTTYTKESFTFTAKASFAYVSFDMGGSPVGSVTWIDDVTVQDLSGSGGGQTSIIANGGFEAWSGSAPQNWTILNAASAGSGTGNGDFSKGTGSNDVHKGNNSLKVTISGTGNDYNTQIASSELTTKQGDIYKVTFWIKASEANCKYQVEGRSGSDLNSAVDTKYSGDQATPATYTQESFTFTAQASNAYITFDMGASPAGSVTWIDDVNVIDLSS